MKTHLIQTGAAVVLAATADATESTELNSILERMRDNNPKVRGEAWSQAAQCGVTAIKPLVALLDHAEVEVFRAAQRALSQIVHQAGKPGATEAAASAAKTLAQLLPESSTRVRRELLWLLSEIAGDSEVAPVAAWLSDLELREDARLVLQRIPGDPAIKALQKGLTTAPEDFKPHLAQSLRARGVTVDGYPSEKLVPVKKTTVGA